MRIHTKLVMKIMAKENDTNDILQTFSITPVIIISACTDDDMH